MYRRALLGLALVALVAGCNGGSAAPPSLFTGTRITPSPSPTPTPTPLVQHLYVGNYAAAGGIAQYTLPITASSKPNFTLATIPNVLTVAVDPSGNVAAGDASGNLAYYSLAGGSTMSAAFRNGTALFNEQIAFTNAGDLFASTRSVVNEFLHPLSNSSHPAKTVTPPGSAGGIALDTAQNLYVVSQDVLGATNQLFVFAPPYGGSPIVTPPVLGGDWRQIAVGATQLFIAEPGLGTVVVYNLPLTATSVPAFSIFVGVAPTVESVAVDAAGRLYVGTAADGTVRVYDPPFSAASTPVVTMPVSGFAIFGIAIGK